MQMMLQLNPQIPVYVPDKGTGTAFALIDYSQEHFVHFMVALDDTGEIWILDNTKVRFQKNVSLGRLTKPIEPVLPSGYQEVSRSDSAIVMEPYDAEVARMIKTPPYQCGIVPL
jgi:hypothetical protein